MYSRSYDAPLSLFEDHRMVRTFGALGKGPCEYTLAQSFDMSGDSLFVLSTAQSKIITYRISTGECLGELNVGSLVDRSYLARAGGGFYIGRFAYYAGTPDSTVMLHRLEDDGTMRPLELTLGMLDPVPMIYQMPAFTNDFRRQGDRLYAYFRYTNYLVSLDVQSEEVELLPLDLELHREEIEEAGNNFRQVNEIRENDLHGIGRIQASERWIAASEMIGNGNYENTMWLQFYSHQGEPIGRIYTRDYPVAELDGHLVYVLPSEDPSSEYASRLYYREVILQ
ncbi:MAG: 6-bladed beta-propeller [Balneolaceae bacterium]|nr:6-bladed beta-propeller [Balneolaceae bacterium]